MSKRRRNQVFISYSHADKEWLRRLRTILKPLERQGRLAVWDDTAIKPGQLWPEEIKRSLSQAKVAVLLVSSDFFASDFIQDNELPPLLKAAESEGVTILWVAITASMYEETDLAKYQCANNPAKPLDSLGASEQNAELVRIGRLIMLQAEAETPAVTEEEDMSHAHAFPTSTEAGRDKRLPTSMEAGKDEGLKPVIVGGLITLIVLALVWAFNQKPPALRGDIEKVEVAEKQDGAAQVFILLSVKNLGPPTMVHKYSLRISHATSTSINFKGPPTELRESYTLPEVAGEERIVIQPKDAIQSKTAHAIAQNAKVGGWMMLELPPVPMLTRDFLCQSGIKYTVSFEDATGKTYETTYQIP